MTALPNSNSTLVDSNATADDAKSPRPAELDDHFDPYDYGPKDGIGSWAAIAHIIRATVGSGVLVMPYAMRTLGYATGTALMAFVSFVYFHNVHSLLSTEYRLCKLLKARRLTFISMANTIFERAPPPFSKLRLPVQTFMYFMYSLPISNTVILVVMSTSVRYLAAYANAAHLSDTLVITALLLPLTACCMFDRLLRILTPYSALTNALAAAMAVVLVGCSVAFGRTSAPPRAFGGVDAVPQGAALFVQTVCCVGIFIPVKNDMRRPAQLRGATGAVNVAAVALTAFYVAFGVLCYAFYGDDVRDNVLTNLPADGFVSFVVHLLYASELLVAYVLSFYVYFQNVWSARLQQTFEGSSYRSVVEYALRLVMNLVAYGMAIGIPKFALISTVSGTLSMVVEIALPSVLQLLFELALRGKKSRWVVAKNACIIAFSAFLFVFSVKDCVREIVNLYST